MDSERLLFVYDSHPSVVYRKKNYTASRAAKAVPFEGPPPKPQITKIGDHHVGCHAKGKYCGAGCS